MKKWQAALDKNYILYKKTYYKIELTILDVYRNSKISINDTLLRKIVYSIKKAIGDDQQQYLRENQKETNNA